LPANPLIFSRYAWRSLFARPVRAVDTYPPLMRPLAFEQPAAAKRTTYGFREYAHLSFSIPRDDIGPLAATILARLQKRVGFVGFELSARKLEIEKENGQVHSTHDRGALLP
jgi:hypothetical protein